ncbi:hypothetical protein Sjap_015229 [Stephania japonica]|uniref:Uncharacterized protein n=1 Tax=Stephania japonica TaxID=461633 RepID=A0AAP0IKL3_9MAGN
MEELEVSPSVPDIIIAQNEGNETEKEIEEISKCSEEEQIECKEDQPLVLVKPPTLPCILVEFKKGVEVKERSQIFYTANTLVLGDQDEKESFMLEVSNELLILKKGMIVSLPNAIDAPFFVDISKGKGVILDEHLRHLEHPLSSTRVCSGSFWRETKRFGIFSKLALQISAAVRVWTADRGCSSLAAP